VPIEPVLQALLLADNVYTDAGTGKRIIAGTFDSLRAAELPATFDRVTAAYICLTEVRGEIGVVLRYVDLDDNEVLMEHGPTQVRSDDPLASVDFVVPVPPIPMPHPGVFAFEVHSRNELLGFLRITVVQVEPEEHGGEEEEKVDE
jgi:hypothetical protein